MRLTREEKRDALEFMRQAIERYRKETGVGDPTIAKELALPKHATLASAVKNVQRLRKGENIREGAFFSACMERF